MKKEKLLITLISLGVITSCTTNNEQTNSSNNTTTLTEPEEDNSPSEQTTSVSSQEKKLTINNKCIGCRHCSKFAPSNFEMNYSTHKAEVISQENIDSSSVKRAIDRCPTNAIEIS